MSGLRNIGPRAEKVASVELRRTSESRSPPGGPLHIPELDGAKHPPNQPGTAAPQLIEGLVLSRVLRCRERRRPFLVGFLLGRKSEMNQQLCITLVGA